MNVSITPAPLSGTLDAIPSKSEAHRMLICAALADAPTLLRCGGSSADIDATVRCLNAMGAQIRRTAEGFQVQPIDRATAAQKSVPCDADCGESGSTLRFLLPVSGALGIDTRFHLHGRLAERPIAPLDRELARGGCRLSRPEPEVLRIEGRLAPGSYSLPGNVSSQYVTGLLLALSLPGEASRLRLEGALESAGYVEMTLHVLRRFGAQIAAEGGGYLLSPGPLTTPGVLTVEGDWSNAAFWLCAGSFGKTRVRGLDAASAQGDRAAIEILRRMGAGVTAEPDGFSVCGASARDCEIDASAIPDLIPALCAFACANGKTTRITHAARLRLKESDRLRAITQTLNALGADVTELPDGLILRGRTLTGGEVDSMNDHRIAMMAAIAACACTGPVRIRRAEAVNKSYPGFWADYERLGGKLRLEEVAP